MVEQFGWTNLRLTEETTLVLGFRPKPGSRELVAGRVEIKRELARSLAEAGARWLDDLRTRTGVRYESDLHLEPDEFLATSVPELVAHAPATPEGSEASDGAREDGDRETDTAGAAALNTLLSGAFASDDWFTADQLRRSFLFYAVVVKLESSGSVAFVKQTSPQRVAKTGGWLTIYGDTLSEITQPVFVLEPDVDIVVHDQHIAVLKPLAFERLYADLELSKELIPDHVQTITESLSCSSSLGPLLESVTSTKVRARRLLRDISSFGPGQWAARTNERIREVLAARQIDADDFFDDSGKLAVKDDQVVTLLEVLASRYFTSDFDGEEMRADKVRRRT